MVGDHSSGPRGKPEPLSSELSYCGPASAVDQPVLAVYFPPFALRRWSSRLFLFRRFFFVPLPLGRHLDRALELLLRPPPIWKFGTTADFIAAKARQDRLDHVALIDDEVLGGQQTLATALAKQGQLEGYVVGGCCELSTSVHHLMDKLGVELGF